MKLVRWGLLLAILAVIFTPTTVMLAQMTATGVTITATPVIRSGISNFTITYISDTQLDISWTLDADAILIMIRGKYSAYPSDTANVSTNPTDGYLAYSGNGTVVSDMSMDFNQNPGPLYFKAWAQRTDGTWFPDTESGVKESQLMTLLALFACAGIVSWLAFWQKHPFLYIVASIVLVGEGIYLVTQGGLLYNFEGVGMILLAIFCLYETSMMYIGKE